MNIPIEGLIALTVLAAGQVIGFFVWINSRLSKIDLKLMGITTALSIRWNVPIQKLSHPGYRGFHDGVEE